MTDFDRFWKAFKFPNVIAGWTPSFRNAIAQTRELRQVSSPRDSRAGGVAGFDDPRVGDFSPFGTLPHSRLNRSGNLAPNRKKIRPTRLDLS